MHSGQQQYTQQSLINPQSENQVSAELLTKLVELQQGQQVQFNQKMEIEEQKLLRLESTDQRK